MSAEGRHAFVKAVDAGFDAARETIVAWLAVGLKAGAVAFFLCYVWALVTDERVPLWWRVTFAVAMGILVLFQATFGSWLLAGAVLITLPIALAGAGMAAIASGSALSLGSLAGLLTVFAIAVRQSILLVHRYRVLRKQGAVEFGPQLVLQGTRDSATSILTTSLVTAAAVIPFAVLGSKPGLEILGPMALVVLGGLFTATTASLMRDPPEVRRDRRGVRAASGGKSS